MDAQQRRDALNHVQSCAQYLANAIPDALKRSYNGEIQVTLSVSFNNDVLRGLASAQTGQMYSVPIAQLPGAPVSRTSSGADPTTPRPAATTGAATTTTTSAGHAPGHSAPSGQQRVGQAVNASVSSSPADALAVLTNVAVEAGRPPHHAATTTASSDGRPPPSPASETIRVPPKAEEGRTPILPLQSSAASSPQPSVAAAPRSVEPKSPGAKKKDSTGKAKDKEKEKSEKRAPVKSEDVEMPDAPVESAATGVPAAARDAGTTITAAPRPSTAAAAPSRECAAGRDCVEQSGPVPDKRCSRPGCADPRALYHATCLTNAHCPRCYTGGTCLNCMIPALGDAFLAAEAKVDCFCHGVQRGQRCRGASHQMCSDMEMRGRSVFFCFRCKNIYGWIRLKKTHAAHAVRCDLTSEPAGGVPTFIFALLENGRHHVLADCEPFDASFQGRAKLDGFFLPFDPKDPPGAPYGDPRPDLMIERMTAGIAKEIEWQTQRTEEILAQHANGGGGAGDTVSAGNGKRAHEGSDGEAPAKRQRNNKGGHAPPGGS